MGSSCERQYGGWQHGCSSVAEERVVEGGEKMLGQ